MQHSIRSSSSARRPLIGIIANGSTVYGRDVIMGATQYSNAHRQWEVYGVLSLNQDGSIDLPPCDGAIVAGLATAFDVVCARSRHVISCAGDNKSSKALTVCLDYNAVGAMGAKHLIECGLQIFSYYGIPGAVPSIV